MVYVIVVGDLMSGSYLKCPKCGSHTVEVLKNQERICGKCGYVFYFVTPNCGTQLDLSRYDF
jgi:uncharacterized Zn finger protein